MRWRTEILTSKQTLLVELSEQMGGRYIHMWMYESTVFNTAPPASQWLRVRPSSDVSSRIFLHDLPAIMRHEGTKAAIEALWGP
jgi:hypothetical protein